MVSSYFNIAVNYDQKIPVRQQNYKTQNTDEENNS